MFESPMHRAASRASHLRGNTSVKKNLIVSPSQKEYFSPLKNKRVSPSISAQASYNMESSFIFTKIPNLKSPNQESGRSPSECKEKIYDFLEEEWYKKNGI